MIRGAPATGPPLFLSPEKEGEANVHEYFMSPIANAAIPHDHFMPPIKHPAKRQQRFIPPIQYPEK